MLARKLPPPPPGDDDRRPQRGGDEPPGGGPGVGGSGRRGVGAGGYRPPRRPQPAQRCTRSAGPVPTRGPQGEVEWWTRPAPGGDELLWEATKRVHARKLATGLSAAQIVQRLEARHVSVRRETLSRVLNGNQATSWDLIETLADVLGVQIADLAERRDARGTDS